MTRRSSAAEQKSITVLMGVYNGAPYLQEMLESLVKQEHSDWTLLASIDTSADHSATILHDFLASRPEGQVQLRSGPGRGFTVNYLSLLAAMDADKNQWLAFADQDDVWLPQRLSRGLRALEEVVAPTLAAGPVWCVLDDLSHRRISGGWPGQAGFRNALVQNVVQGNTMLANPAAASLLVTAARKVLDAGNIPISHDWWAYQVVTGAGGQICKIAQPSVLYRQHGGNLIGANDTSLATVRRLKKAFQGQQRAWAGANIAALSACKPLLTSEANGVLDTFAVMHMTNNPVKRVRALMHLRPVRQTKAGTLALWAAAIIGCI